MCDNDILALCEKMAYYKYKEQMWEAMIRNKFRLKFQHEPLCMELQNLQNNDKSGIGKEIFRFSCKKLISIFQIIRVSKTCDNVVYLINAAELHREEIYHLTPSILMRKYSNYEITMNKTRD